RDAGPARERGKPPPGGGGGRQRWGSPARRVGSLRARTTGPRPVSDPGCSSGVPTREADGYAIIKPGHTKRGPAYPGNNHTPGKAGPHSCSISENASANTACSTASPKRPSPKKRACTPTPSKNSSRAAPRAWTPSTASPVPSTQPPAASSPAAVATLEQAGTPGLDPPRRIARARTTAPGSLIASRARRLEPGDDGTLGLRGLRRTISPPITVDGDPLCDDTEPPDLPALKDA